MQFSVFQPDDETTYLKQVAERLVEEEKAKTEKLERQLAEKKAKEKAKEEAEAAAQAALRAKLSEESRIYHVGLRALREAAERERREEEGGVDRQP